MGTNKYDDQSFEELTERVETKSKSSFWNRVLLYFRRLVGK
jgi:hypothetical protein